MTNRKVKFFAFKFSFFYFIHVVSQFFFISYIFVAFYYYFDHRKKANPKI